MAVNETDEPAAPDANDTRIERQVEDPESLAPLRRVLERLRGEGGCPWDRQQTPQSMCAFVLEEAHELVDAIDHGDPAAIREELGDVLLQVAFQAQFARETGSFTLADVITTIVDKLIERHPHVFGERAVGSAEEVLVNWERDKLARADQQRQSLLDGVPLALPALTRAQRVQQRAAGVGFDWPDVHGPADKVREELGEIEVELGATPPRQEALAEEIGDLLFAAVNLARKAELDAESTLRAAIAKFTGRFQQMERQAHQHGHDLHAMSLEALEELWEQAKSAAPPAAEV